MTDRRYKLTPAQAVEIKTARSRYGYAREFARRFNISPRTVYAIRRGDIWASAITEV